MFALTRGFEKKELIHNLFLLIKSYEVTFFNAEMTSFYPPLLITQHRL